MSFDLSSLMLPCTLTSSVCKSSSSESYDESDSETNVTILFGLNVLLTFLLSSFTLSLNLYSAALLNMMNYLTLK